MSTEHLWNDTDKEILKYLAENQSQCSYIPPKIPHNLVSDRRRSSAVTDRLLASCTMTESFFWKFFMLIQFWVSGAV